MGNPLIVAYLSGDHNTSVACMTIKDILEMKSTKSTWQNSQTTFIAIILLWEREPGFCKACFKSLLPLMMLGSFCTPSVASKIVI